MSQFDFYLSSMYNDFTMLFWVISLSMVPVLVFHQGAWVGPCSTRLVQQKFLGLVGQVVSQTFPGFALMLTTVFGYLAALNLMGLLPWSFTFTAYPFVSLCVAFTLWASVLLSSCINDFSKVLSGFVPTGVPLIMAPFMCVVELVSVLVRPLVLTVRLVANMVAGHLLLTVVSALSLQHSSAAWLALVPLTALEVGVCVLQAYVFVMLLALYCSEHSVAHPLRKSSQKVTYDLDSFVPVTDEDSRFSSSSSH